VPFFQFERIFLMGNLEVCFRILSKLALDFEQSSLSKITGCLILTPSQKTLHTYLKPSVSLAPGYTRSGFSIASKKLDNKYRFSFRVFRVKSSFFFPAESLTKLFSADINGALRLLSMLLTFLGVVIFVLKVFFI
jgi:hypothetical protein